MVLLTTVHDCLGQHQPIDALRDSLRQIWNNPNAHDTIRLKALDKLAWDGFLFSNPESAFYYASIESAFAQDVGNDLFLARSLNIKASSFLLRGEQDSALKYFKSILTMGDRIPEAKIIPNTYNNIGLAYKRKGEYRLAIENFRKSLEMKQKLGDLKGAATSLNNIGIILKEQGDHARAIDHYMQSLHLSEQMEYVQAISNALNNIGVLHDALGDDERAMEFYTRALKIDEEQGDAFGQAAALINIGSLHLDWRSFDLALEKYGQALQLYTELEDPRGMAECIDHMGSVRLQMGELNIADSLFQKALSLSVGTDDPIGEISSLLNLARIAALKGRTSTQIKYAQQALGKAQTLGRVNDLAAASYLLYEAYQQLGQSSNALSMFKLHIDMRDSVASEQNAHAVMRQQFQYDLEKQELFAKAEQERMEAIAQIEIKKKDFQRNVSLGGLIFSLFAAGIFLVQRNSISREKERSEELLLNILPYETAQELKEKGSSEAKLIDHVTVLFTDFKGFTALSEQVTPKELVEDLNECFSAFDRICEKHGIEKIKTIGDAYMAAGGLPTVNDTHALDVTRAALEMRDFIEVGKVRKQAAGLPFFQIRIGVHTGPVVAGIVGVKKFQYDIWGDTVNTASRMESSGEVGQVNLSEDTYELVKHHFHCQYRGRIEAKGKGLLSMYFVQSKIQSEAPSA